MRRLPHTLALRLTTVCGSLVRVHTVLTREIFVAEFAAKLLLTCAVGGVVGCIVRVQLVNTVVYALTDLA